MDLPTITTPRLVLRALGEADVDDLFAIYGDAEVMRHASDAPFPTRDTVYQMLASVAALRTTGESLEWGMVLRSSGRVVGTCGLHNFVETTAEVGCLLARSQWGSGRMAEALAALFAYARDELGLTTLVADIDAPNLRSIRFFAKMGFVQQERTIYQYTLRVP